MMRVVFVACVVTFGFAVAAVWLFSRAQARERESIDATGDLYGLATAILPRGYRALGLDGADRSLSPAEQLARHDESASLTFRFTQDPGNDWGGHPKDPELLNIVLLAPSAREKPEEALQRFSIERYYTPTGETIPLDSPRWEAGSSERYRWRVLAMKDHYGTAQEPRWAIAMLDPARGIRLDFFVWQRRIKQADALTLLRGMLDSLQLQPALTDYFAQADGVQARLDRLREQNLQGVFAALAPFGLQAPAAGETSFGRGVAAWLDVDRAAVRVMRVLASVPLPQGAAKADIDGQGRPQLPLVLEPGQYPGPTRGGLPALHLQMLYWNPSLDRWQRSGLQQATMHEDYPLLPFEEAVVARLDTTAGARDAVHVILGEHWFHPPALDDARRIGPLLEECARWEAELLAGRIIGGEVRPSMLQ